MIIDDEKLQLTLRTALLESRGHEVVALQDGKEAIETFLRQSIDLVISDLLMPTITGLDLARQLKSHNPSVPIILLTGWGKLLGDKDSQHNSVDYILSKPCEPEFLIAAVEECLNSTRSPRAATAEI